MNNPDRTAQQERRYIALLDLPTPSLPISQRFARRLRYERRVASYKLGGRVYFDETDLRDFINAGRTEAR
jgi:hypothetical protein